MIEDALRSAGLPAPYLAALAASAVALALRAAASRRTARDRRALADSALLGRLIRPPPPGLIALRAVALALGSGALAASILAAAAAGHGADSGAENETVLVLDASNSMWANDVKPNRLMRQREIAAELATRLSGRVGVVYFSGRGYVLSPLTGDRDAALMFVDAVDPALVGRGGTSLASGLEQALGVLAGGRKGARRTIVLLTDGEGTGAEQALPGVVSRAVRSGVRVFVIGLGTRSGSRIPIPRAERERLGVDRPEGAAAFIRDAGGREVVSRLHESLLREIARSTGGAYVPGTEAGVVALLGRLDDLVASDGATPASMHLLLLAAFGVLLAEGFLFRRG